ncbi:EFR1 family ferrodoxin [Orenia marismortui]|uniref:4Fe-4S binding protein n=1 Tax=Orenia marismortui TaxID=46469 RepID=A0A4R8H3L8_9FIRM|nr:EFR1 family ferrodoxin [Orenia marismortui]TDX51184.1 4Fe-4S binding protein [Orenia marismortui]
MKKSLFYFSATGNSLAITREIANKLEDCQLISIAEAVKKDKYDLHSDIVGILFPVYCLDIPKIVKEFLKKLNFNGNPYIFAIATNNGKPGFALDSVDKLLKEKNQKLDLGYTLIMPGNSVVIQDHTNCREEQIVRLNNSKVIISEMIKDIQKKKKGIIEGDFSVKARIKRLIYKLAVYKIYKPQNHFWITEECILCGICKQICPKDNITLKNKEVRWNSNCEACLACFHWCPQSAINLGKNTMDKIRYHHPKINLDDIVK